MEDRHRTVFGTVEREYWTEAAGLKPDERTLIERYLDPHASTLEAGAGGGRIVGEMRRLGFTDLAGFDFVPELVVAARSADPTGEIRFDVQDARDLGYPDASFAQALYLQQLLSSIETAADRRRVVAQAFRILKPGGIAVFSVLPFEIRRRSAPMRPYLAYLRLLRRARGSKRPDQLLPRMRMRGRPTAAALLDRGPHVYWYLAGEVEHELAGAGFELVAIGTTPQVIGDEMSSSAEGLAGRSLAGALYAVCRRPG